MVTLTSCASLPPTLLQSWWCIPTQACRQAARCSAARRGCMPWKLARQTVWCAPTSAPMSCTTVGARCQLIPSRTARCSHAHVASFRQSMAAACASPPLPTCAWHASLLAAGEGAKKSLTCTRCLQAPGRRAAASLTRAATAAPPLDPTPAHAWHHKTTCRGQQTPPVPRGMLPLPPRRASAGEACSCCMGGLQAACGIALPMCCCSPVAPTLSACPRTANSCPSTPPRPSPLPATACACLT